MANPHRGEVAIEAGEETFTLRYDFNALCELEERVGRPAVELLVAMSGRVVGARDLRAMVWAGLLSRHPEITIEGAGSVIDAAGVNASMAAVGKALNLAFPDDREGGSRRPRRAAARNRSSS